MAAIGSGINATLGRQDFSGITQGGQMMAQGILAGGQGIARGIEAAGQGATDAIKQYQQNKLMTGVQISKFEAAMQSDNDGSLQQALQGSPDAAKLVQKMAKNGNLNLKEASQLGAFVDTFSLAKQREQAAMQKQQAIGIDAYNAETARINATQNGSGAPTSAMRDTDAIIQAELYSQQLKPENVEKRRAQLLKQGGRDQERYDNAGTFVRRDNGQDPIQAVKNRETGQFGTVNKDGVFEVLDPEKYKPSTTSDSNPFMNEETFYNKFTPEFIQKENGVKSVLRFMKGAKDLPTGVNKLSTRISAFANTLMGEKLSKDELAMGESAARQQRLLGALRTTILGPGVLTEIDAQRIMDAVGGDVKAITTNPEVMHTVLGEILQEKVADYEQSLDIYNAHVAGKYGQARLKQRKKIDTGFDMNAQAAAPAPAQAPAAGGALVWNPATKSFTRQ